MDIMTLFIILFGVIGLETLLIVFVIIKTPAIPFLSASLTKRPIMISIGKDKLANFRPFKVQFGSGVVKNEGIYNLTENSHILESKTKTAMYIAFRDFAATMPPEYPAMIQELREKGYKITTMDDVENIISNIKGAIEQDITINVKPFKTYKVHDMTNMFPLNLDPTFVDAQVQGELNKFSKLMKAAPQMLMGVIILVIVASIAVFILQKAFTGSISAQDCQAMVSAAKCGGQAIVNTVNSTALVP